MKKPRSQKPKQRAGLRAPPTPKRKKTARASRKRDVGKGRRKTGKSTGAPARKAKRKKKAPARSRLHTATRKKARSGQGKARRRKTTASRRPAAKKRKTKRKAKRAPRRSGRVLVHRKPTKKEWGGALRKFTKAAPKTGNFSGVVLIRARFESRPKKVLTVPVGIGYTNRKELRELGRAGLEDLVRSIKPTASEVEIVGVVALKPRKDRRGIRVRRQR